MSEHGKKCAAVVVVVVTVVVGLPHTPSAGLRSARATHGRWTSQAQLVMTMVGWEVAGMEVVDGKHAGQSQEFVTCREMPEHFPSVR